MIKADDTNVLLCVILSKKITQSISIHTTYISEISVVSHITVRRSSKPVPYYCNSSATFRLILPSDIESNPGPDKECASIRKRKQSKPISPTCQVCSKIVRANVDRLLCIHCKNLFHLKCKETWSVKKIQSYDVQQGVCQDCHVKELPFLIHVMNSIVRLWLRIKFISALDIWIHSLWVRHLMSSKSCFTNILLILLLCSSKPGYEIMYTYYNMCKYHGYIFCHKSRDKRRGGGVGLE